MQNLLWDPTENWLFSGSFDKSIVVWDVGARQGLALELNGHADRLVGISYDKSRKLLISCSADGRIGIWPMNVKRGETPKWLEGDVCQICTMPFFWNVRAMWTQRQIGLRQVGLSHRRVLFCGQGKISRCSTTVVNVAEQFVISVLKHARLCRCWDTK